MKLKRVGSHNDGGYLIPAELIKKTQTLLSFGLNDDWSFEESFKKINDRCNVYTFDHTVNRKFWYEYTILSIFYFIKNFKNYDKIIKFIKYYSFFQNKLNNFHIKKKIVPKKIYLNEISINEIIRSHKEKIFLKMDIENDEYRILNFLPNFKRILGFVAEFHYIDLNYKIIKNFLLKYPNFKIVHVHPNNMGGIDIYGNPTTVEITFVNKKFCNERSLIKNKKFSPHVLDAPNNPFKKDIKFIFCESSLKKRKLNLE
jgi:hypothetical protein